MARHSWQYLLLFLTHLSIALAASPTTFCKCTCYSNSTIIPLNQPAPFDPNSTLAQHRTCNDCTRQFCLDYNLPICSGIPNPSSDSPSSSPANGETPPGVVVAKCFQRGSTKDEAIVLIFCFATLALLAWAVAKPWVVRWRGRGGGVLWHEYAPVGSGRVGGQ